MRNYLTFVLENRRFLAYGLLFTMTSSVGHTYFIGLFGAEIRAEFGLSHGSFGSIYSLATLGSGIAVIWLGRKIDDVDLRHYTAMVCAGLVAACFFLALAPGVAFLGLALFALRLAGPGLTVNAATTSMARYFGGQRGKAAGIASLGQTMGEAALPLIAVALIAAIGWRLTWGVLGTAVALLIVPAVLWMLKGHGERHRRLLEDPPAETARRGPSGRQYTRRQVLRDPRFYLILPATLAHVVILSGLFFHQVHLADTKGWSLAWLASCFVGYAVAKVAATLVSGQLVDRLGAQRLLPYYMAPTGLALLALVFFDHPGIALFYMMAMGLGTGAWITISGALWAEIYGIAHLGEVRALVQALMLISVALAPPAMGWLIDRGIGMEAIAVICLGFGAGCTALLFVPAIRAGASPAEN
ncbi:MAG: MFS transporter [Proteobacteria bacterium]|nr:MFS transporter [Pseudomonadota bacterium]